MSNDGTECEQRRKIMIQEQPINILCFTKQMKRLFYYLVTIKDYVLKGFFTSQNKEKAAYGTRMEIKVVHF